ncbi:MAG TPA: hypothetical protein PLV45_09860, partial [bacterium]|nr:hypothetical protein [bacterium]
MTPGFLRSIPARGRPAAGLAGGLAGTLVIIGVLFPFCPPVFNAVVATRTACLEARREFPRALDMLEKWKGGMPVRRWRNDLMRSAAMGALFNGQFREACEYFTPIADIRDPVTGQSRPDYFMRIYRGISFEKRGMVNEARDDWEAAIAVIPRRHDAWLARGHSRLLDGDPTPPRFFFSRP